MANRAAAGICPAPGSREGAGLEATHGTSDVSAVDFNREPRSRRARNSHPAQKNAAVARPRPELLQSFSELVGASHGLLDWGGRDLNLYICR